MDAGTGVLADGVGALLAAGDFFEASVLRCFVGRGTAGEFTARSLCAVASAAAASFDLLLELSPDMLLEDRDGDLGGFGCLGFFGLMAAFAGRRGALDVLPPSSASASDPPTAAEVDDLGAVDFFRPSDGKTAFHFQRAALGGDPSSVVVLGGGCREEGRCRGERDGRSRQMQEKP